MNEAAIESAGTTPIDPLLARDRRHSANANDRPRDRAAPSLGSERRADILVAPRRERLSETLATLFPGGLGIPDRESTTEDDDHAQNNPHGYLTYIATQLQNLGESRDAAAAGANGILALETSLAKVTPNAPSSSTRSEPTTPPPSRASRPWRRRFRGARSSHLSARRRSPTSTSFLRRLVASFGEQLGASVDRPPGAPICASISSTRMPRAAQAFADPSFAFHSGVLQGVKQQLPRWQRCVDATDRRLPARWAGLRRSVLHARKQRRRAVAMVDNLQNRRCAPTSSARLDERSNEAYAVQKLNAFTKKIGYPTIGRTTRRLRSRRAHRTRSSCKPCARGTPRSSSRALDGRPIARVGA